MAELFDNEYLKKLEYLELIARRLVFGRRQAQRMSARKGASIEFREFREYSPGDDPRTVDWSVYARLGELVVKLYRQEQELDLWLLLDRSASMGFGELPKFDYARRVVGALAYIGMSDMDSASVLPFADALAPGCERLRGRGRIFRLLEFLSALDVGGTTSLTAVTRAFVTRVRRPGLVVLVSDFYGLQSAQHAIDQLRFFRHEVFAIQLATPWELDPTIRGDMRLVDVESDDRADIVITDSMLRRYRASFEHLSEEIRRHCMRRAVGYALVNTDTPFDTFLVEALQRGGLVA